ncbi:MAG: Gfo/Idh/MocA family oxidoreductase [Gemmatimonadaceae bacterium]|nr:Gfo/Idh/MocA family oxidoreductase [Gemmatimonadaceae bacterium]
MKIHEAPVRWGIIGCGDVTEVKSGPALHKAEGSELAAVMRRDRDKARDYARRHGVPRWYDDAGALIEDEGVDAVYVATPPDSHPEYTLRAAAAGKPVYVEKPMARTAAECEEMVSACRRAGVPLFVAYYRRRLPVHLKVAELLAQGAVGGVRTVAIRLFKPAGGSEHTPDSRPWRVDPVIAGEGGHFHDLGCHQLDLLDYLLGPIEAAAGVALCQGGLYACRDTVTASWRHESGAAGSGAWCFVADSSTRVEEIEITGGDGCLRFAAFDLERPVRLERGSEVEEFAVPAPAHVQQPLIQSVVDDLLGRGACPSTGDSALRTARVMDRILGLEQGERRRLSSPRQLPA